MGKCISYLLRISFFFPFFPPSFFRYFCGRCAKEPRETIIINFKDRSIPQYSPLLILNTTEDFYFIISRDTLASIYWRNLSTNKERVKSNSSFLLLQFVQHIEQNHRTNLQFRALQIEMDLFVLPRNSKKSSSLPMRVSLHGRGREREILFNKRGRTLVRVIVPGHFAGILKPAGSDFWSVHRDGVFIVTSQYRENRRKVKEPGPRENEREGEGERSLLHGGGFSGTMEFQPRFLAKQFRNSFRRGS